MVVGSGRARPEPAMTAAWMWARAELRGRWKAWLLLGLLAGVTMGVAAAGWAGARRTERAVPDAVREIGLPTAAVLPNDPTFGPEQRGEVGRLPGVTERLDFMVSFASEVYSPRGLGDVGGLLPIGADTMRFFARPLVEGRMPDPRRADEATVNEVMRDRFGLDIGSTMVVGQDEVRPEELSADLVPPGGVIRIRQRLRVVGISKSVSSDPDWTASSAFYDRYHDHITGVVNQFVTLRGGAAA